MKEGKYIKENGKTFWEHCGNYTRAHDENFSGPRFKYSRCPFCNRLTGMHVLHWLNHIEVCAPLWYSIENLLEMRYKQPSEIRHLHPEWEIGIGRKGYKAKG